jgi:hypothetical protein
MRKKGRWIPVLLCLCIFAGMALGSGSTNSDSTEKSIVSDNGTQAAEETSDVSIEKQVLVDEKDIVITATEYVTDSIMGDGIKVLLENNSDKDVMVGCDALIVNDYMITDLFASEVAAGKKSNDTIYLSSSELDAAGIETVGKVEIYFRAYDPDSLDDIFKTDCVEIKTSEYDNIDTEVDDSGEELYNDNGIRIVGKTVDENSFWGTAILLYIENNSEKNVGISVDDMSINGFMMSPYFSTTVYDGKKAVDDITIFDSDLEENEIESVEDVELKFHIYDNDSYDTIADSDTITFSAK